MPRFYHGGLREAATQGDKFALCFRPKKLSFRMDSGADKRRRRRVAISTYRMVADFDGENQPAPDSFYQVTLKNLSTMEASFSTQTPPQFNQIIIQLGKDGLPVEAKVVRVRQTGDGFEVGCEFARPLD